MTNKVSNYSLNYTLHRDKNVFVAELSVLITLRK